MVGPPKTRPNTEGGTTDRLHYTNDHDRHTRRGAVQFKIQQNLPPNDRLSFQLAALFCQPDLITCTERTISDLLSRIISCCKNIRVILD